MTRAEALEQARPITFNAEAIWAILNDKMTATRQLVKSNKADLSKCRFVEMSTDPAEIRIARNGDEYPHDLKGLYATFEDADGEYFPLVKSPYQVGDILYVRETWCKRRFVPPDDKAIPVGFKYCEYYYRANGEIINSDGSKFKWKPSIHMPKEAARIFLRVTGIRVERLQDIITGDYKTTLNINREGLIYPCGRCTHPNGECKDFIAKNTCRLVDGYADLWDSTTKKSDIEKYGWGANPWVWVIEFEWLEVKCNEKHIFNSGSLKATKDKRNQSGGYAWNLGRPIQKPGRKSKVHNVWRD